jgi:COP9 signalosome complex subunit 5
MTENITQAAGSSIGLKQWMLENDIQIDETTETLYSNTPLPSDRPWTREYYDTPLVYFYSEELVNLVNFLLKKPNNKSMNSFIMECFFSFYSPHHFKHVKISAVALIKMVIHARRGGNLEIMGLMQGKVMGDTMVVMDAFALPVEGTETRVNAQQEAFEYMVQYQSTSSEVH